MKVLAVFPPLHDENPGGIQVAGRVAWDALRKHGAELLEVSARERWRAVRAARAQSDHFDVVLFWHLDLLRLAPLISRTAKRVVFLHGIEAWRRPDLFTGHLLRHASVIANSTYTAERARAALPVRAEMQVVHLGLGEPLAAHKEPEATPIALMISRLDAAERYKGHHEVIDAWPRVQQQLPAAQLWIVGDGDMRAELETLAATQSIRFFGRVSESEKQKLIEAARCLVLPSSGEGFGLVYLEAMRTGRPCLVGVDAGREVVEPPTAGLSVEPGNQSALVDTLVKLLTRGAEWEQMSVAARRRYAEHFTSSHFDARLLAALQRLH